MGMDWNRMASLALALAMTACSNVAKESSAAPIESAAQGAHQDMVLMVRKNNSNLKWVNTLEGVKRLSNADELSRFGVLMCIVKLPKAYAGLSEAAVDNVARVEVQRYLGQMANAKELKEIPLRHNDCVELERTEIQLHNTSELVLVQRQALPLLIRGSPWFEQRYEMLHVIGHNSLFATAEQMRQTDARRQQVVVNRNQEIDALAQVNATDKVGSIAFGSPRFSGEVPFCTLSHEGEQGAAIMAYAYRGFATQSDTFRNLAERSRATMNTTNRPYARVYPNIEALYEARQSSPSACLVYVDFPSNLKKILRALQRDGKPTPVVNELVATTVLRDEWAKSNGYNQYADYLTARDLKVNAQQFKSLAQYRISDKVSLEAAVSEMHISGYTGSRDIGDLLSYLKDKAEASSKPGATAVSVREMRQKVARETAEAHAIAERQRREAYAKEYPYFAVLTCGMPNHINIMACFVGGRGGVDTELKLRNGSNSTDSNLYMAYNLLKAGEQRRDGFYIDLRRNFALHAQNGGQSLILGLKIVDRLSGHVLYQDQASLFGVVSARN